MGAVLSFFIIGLAVGLAYKYIKRYRRANKIKPQWHLATSYLLRHAEKSPRFESIETSFENGTASCTIKCKDVAPYTSTFSIREAEDLGFLELYGPWKQYPDKMCEDRAVRWALMHCFRKEFDELQQKQGEL